MQKTTRVVDKGGLKNNCQFVITIRSTAKLNYASFIATLLTS